MAATVSTVYPGFLIGALSVQVSAEFGVSEAAYGWGLGGFFLAATTGSILLGRLAQHIGPRRQILVGLSVTAAMELVIALVVEQWWTLVAVLVVCGLVNAANQTAVNLALTRARIPRLGLAIALKQSGMPLASMLGGLAVPALALTLGWRWAYGLGAVMTMVAAAAVWSQVEPGAPMMVERNDDGRTHRLVSTRHDLVVAAVMGGFLSFAAGALNAWVVGSGVDAGLSEAAAGLMLSLGAGLGIALRVMTGFRLDTMRERPFTVAGLMVLAGAAGIAALSFRSAPIHVAATIVAFAGGWVWPVLTNYGIVRTNADASAAATGITQTGVYVGVFSAPLVTGWLIEHRGYEQMWLVAAGALVVGSALALSVRNRF